ncbi:YetF domain-containing protein [Clostridium tarantellae]|uniref:DUF421 domain-containing protein n=1 Tax=Clostridium tarantellae TaxID=39493 RepID=A0A6I1MML7_9CLOT|nr:DUF421 domain-containing protein [Clostridium tarantellae]MPQ44736.1 DUF421 domain-containing protein [Clostridium tarantellae]
MFIVFIRTAILYLLVILVIRLMGKRQVGELQPFELVITIMISDLAALPMQDTRLPLLLGIIPITTLLFIRTILAELQFRSKFIRKVIDGTPSILISNGKLNIKNLITQRLTAEDILEELRIRGYLDVNQVQYAIMENNGEISIIPKAKYDIITKDDLNLKRTNPSIPIIIYSDGKFNFKALKKIKKNENWVFEELKKLNSPSIDDIYMIVLNSNNKITYEEKNKIENFSGDEIL